MHQILHELEIKAPAGVVFDAFATSEGLDVWWTHGSSGWPEVGVEYRFYFGPDYDWRGRVRRLKPGTLIEWEITKSDRDWVGTHLAAEIEDLGDRTRLRFRHSGWAEVNTHFRQTSYTWALYLRILRRYLEQGIFVPYSARYDD